MQCRYINLADAVERRLAIEASFDKVARPGWDLARFEAVDTQFVDRHAVGGVRSREEKACFLSHKAVIEAHAGRSTPLLVLEDDVEFGIATCEIVDGLLQQNPEADWDLLFLDVCATGIDDMVKLYFHRKDLMRTGSVIPLDLAKIPFFGANAYIVNPRSIPRIVAILDAGVPVDVEYDVYLAAQIREGRLKAAVLFPFVTTLSHHSTSSQIQPDKVEQLNHARSTFRRLVWLERRPEQVAADMAQIEAVIADPEHRAFSAILTSMLMNFRELKDGASPA
jgi:GR25 family glycosyltransferase involved in LPS biosynthesis